MTDISERKRMEETLIESEGRLMQAQAIAHLGSWEIDLTNQTMWASEEAFRIYGIEYTGPASAYMPLAEAQEVVHPEDRPRMDNALKALLQENRIYDQEFRIFRANDGELRVIHSRADLLFSEERLPVKVFGTIQDITDRKQAEEKLRESEERYRHLVKHAPAGIYEVDFTTLKLLSVNDAMCRYTGYTREEFLSMDPMQLHTEESLKSLIQRHANILAGEPVPDSIEYQLKRKDGSEFWALLNNRFSYGPNNRITSTVIVHDITESKRAQDAQIEQLNFLQVLMDTIPIPVFFKDTKGIYLGCNRACETFFGPRDQLVGKTVYDVSPKDIADVYYRADLELFNNPGIQIYETVATDKTGARHNVIFDKATYQDKNGNLAGLIGAIVDITDRKRAEDALQASEEKYRAIIENMQEGYHEVDLNGNFTFVNESTCRMLGYEREELLGMNYRQYADEEDNRKVYQVYNRVYQTGEPVENFEWQIIRKDGDRRDIEVSISLIRDMDDNPTGFRGIVRDTTDRKRAEQELEKAEKRYRSIFENAMEGIYQSTPGGRFLQVNPAMARIYGYDSPDDMEHSVTDIAKQVYVNPDDRKYLKEILEKNDHIEKNEYQVRRKNGDEIWVSNNARAVRDNDENILYFEGLVQDITERKQTEEALRKSEANFQRIFDESPIGAAIVAPDYRFTRVNEAMCRMMGYSQEEFASLRFHDITHPDHLGSDAEQVRRLASGETERYETEKRYIRKDGNIIWGRLSVQAIRDAREQILYFLPMVVDITIRKKMEETLKAERERLASILDGIPVPTLVIDRKRHVLLWNSNNEIYTGIAKEEVLGKPLDLSSIFRDKVSPTVAELIMEMGDEELIARFGMRGLRKSEVQPHAFESTGRIWIRGEEKVIIVQAARIFDTNGKVVGAIQTAQDITDRTRLEAQLRQAQKMEAIGTLAGGIAHDFNNILSAVLGYTEMALGEPKLDSHLRRYLDQVFKAGERARDLVKQILSFSRQSDERPRPLRVSPIVKEVMKLLRASLPIDNKDTPGCPIRTGHSAGGSRSDPSNTDESLYQRSIRHARETRVN